MPFHIVHSNYSEIEFSDRNYRRASLLEKHSFDEPDLSPFSIVNYLSLSRERSLQAYFKYQRRRFSRYVLKIWIKEKRNDLSDCINYSNPITGRRKEKEFTKWTFSPEKESFLFPKIPRKLAGKRRWTMRAFYETRRIESFHFAERGQNFEEFAR